MSAVACIISQRVDGLPVKVRSGLIPAIPPGIGAKNECPFYCSNKQEDVTILRLYVPDAAKNRSRGAALLRRRLGAGDCTRLDGFESGSYFGGSLIAVRGIFGQTPLNDGKESWRHVRRQ